MAPLARDRQRPSLMELARLGLIGGVPTIVGAWTGGFVYSPVWSVLFLAVGVGAIAQVIGQMVRHMTHEGSVGRILATGPVLAGLLPGFVVMYSHGDAGRMSVLAHGISAKLIGVSGGAHAAGCAAAGLEQRAGTGGHTWWQRAWPSISKTTFRRRIPRLR